MPMADETRSSHDVELYLLRHAHAGDPGKWKGDDAQRPLSDKGRDQAERLGAYLAERGFAPDELVSSPRLRALQTAQVVGQAIGVAVSTDDRLAGPLDLDTLAGVIEAAGGRRIVLVGHDPDFSDLAATLCGASYLQIKKGALARIDVPLPLQPASGILRWLLPPDLVGTTDQP
jgi:phosphohistidine phosphatase